MRKGIEVNSFAKSVTSGNIREQFNKGNHIMLFTGVFFSVVSSILSILIAIMLQKFIDVGITGFDELFRLIGISVAIVCINIVVNYLEAFTVNKYVRKAMINVNCYINEKILKLPIRKFSRNKNGKYISILNNDMKIVEQDYIRGMILLIARIIMVICGLFTMIYINYKLTLIVLLSAVLPLLISVLSVGKMEKAQEKVSKSNVQFTSFIKDYLSGFPVIKGFHIEKEIHSKIVDESDKLETDKATCQRTIDIVGALTQNSTVIMIIVLFVVGAALTIKGEMTIGGILAFVQLLNNVTAPITLIIPAFAKYKAAKAILIDADNIVNQNMDEIKTDKINKVELNNKICMKNVSFSYEENGEPVISDISFDFEKGKSYAIVGLSGSGKSTLIRLMAGYFDNYNGDIFVDNIELKDLSEESITKLISLVQQDTFIFDDTIEENIKLYQDWSEDKFNNAIEKAVLDEFIEDRGGVLAICGENGQSFSGGEKQRISVARALLKESPVLLLDEVSSALDLKTSHKLEESLCSLKDITRIAITHKLESSVLENYDCVLFMKSGKIVESGKFEDLLNCHGEFWSMYSLLSQSR